MMMRLLMMMIGEFLRSSVSANANLDSFNIIWTMPPPYSDVTAQTSEDCPGLDD